MNDVIEAINDTIEKSYELVGVMGRRLASSAEKKSEKDGLKMR